MGIGNHSNIKRELVCPNCNKKEIVSYKYWWQVNKKNPNRVCRKCSEFKRKMYHENENNIYKRNCPLCNKEMFYKNPKGLGAAIREKRICYKCSNEIKNEKLKIYPDEDGFFIRFCPLCNKKIKHKVLHRRTDGLKTKRPCRTCSNRLSATPEKNEKIRKNFYKRKDGHEFRFTPSYNKIACEIFNEINNEFGWNGFHAENVGEYKVLGYFLDYYEPNLNIAIEYDEKHHNEKKIKARDEIKQSEITKHLNCKFYRIKYNENWRDVIKNI